MNKIKLKFFSLVIMINKSDMKLIAVKKKNNCQRMKKLMMKKERILKDFIKCFKSVQKMFNNSPFNSNSYYIRWNRNNSLKKIIKIISFPSGRPKDGHLKICFAEEWGFRILTQKKKLWWFKKWTIGLLMPRNLFLQAQQYQLSLLLIIR